MDSSIILYIIGVVLAIIGTHLWQKGNYLRSHGKKAQATVFKNNFHSSRSGGGTYYPVVRFLTDKQEWITQELDFGVNPAMAEGSTLEVIYDPEDPTTVMIHSALQLELLPRLLVAAGVTAVVLASLELLGITHIGN
jgi:hypothetical protein